MSHLVVFIETQILMAAFAEICSFQEIINKTKKKSFNGKSIFDTKFIRKNWTETEICSSNSGFVEFYYDLNP